MILIAILQALTTIELVASFTPDAINSFGAIGDYSRPLVDRCCRLWST